MLFINKKLVFYLTCLSLFVLFMNFLKDIPITKYNKCIFDEPIDIVYTWVNGSDPKFLADLNKYLQINSIAKSENKQQRFDDKYELKFSLRSIEKYSPWFRHVFIVTNGQIPYWLNLEYERVTLITHEDIFLDKDDLPTFSSPAIESHLHRIPGLSKYFVYFNDDIFLGLPAYPEDFISFSKGYLIYMAWPMPVCAVDCPWLYVSDGQCDPSCFNLDCQMDGGDCDDINKFNKWGNIIDNSVYFDGDFKEEKTPNLTFLDRILPRNSNNLNITRVIINHNNQTMSEDKRNRRKMHKNRTKYKFIPYNSNSERRIKLNAFDGSLQHTNRVFNLKYGFKPRQVPAHAPILINKEIMIELHEKFEMEFLRTSKNRWRSPDDLQFSFSYYHFLMHETLNRTIDDIFEMFDTDESGTWSDREIRTVLSKLYELPLSYAIVEHFETLLFNCSENKKIEEVPTPEYERYIDSKLPTISKDLVSNCPMLKEILLQSFGKITRFKHHVLKNTHGQYVFFTMLRSNITEVVGHLDEIRQNPRKFICLNDNLSELETNENELVKAILYDFYLSFFPKPSKFELPIEYKNRFLYLDDYRRWKSNHFKIKVFIYFFVVILVYITVCSICKKRYLCNLYTVFNKLFC